MNQIDPEHRFSGAPSRPAAAMTSVGLLAAGEGEIWAHVEAPAVDPPSAPEFRLAEAVLLDGVASEAARLGHAAADALHVLATPGGHLEVGRARSLPEQLDDLLACFDEADSIGWEVVQTGSDTPLRRLVATDPPTVLLATPTAAVAVDRDGLRMVKRHRTVRAWQQTHDAMLVTTPTAVVRIGRASLSAAMLMRISRGAPAAALLRRPLRVLTASLFDTLRAAAGEAVETNAAIISSVRSVLGERGHGSG